MTFTKKELPPLFNRIINAIEENDGTMDSDDFKMFLIYKIRITKKDIKDIKQWLKKENYIEIEHGFQSENIHLTDKL